MKKHFLFILITCLSVIVYAQTPILPAGQPGKVSLPSPKLKPLTPPDLVVTNIQFVSATRDPRTKILSVKVNVAIKNAGQLKAREAVIKSAVKRSPDDQWVEMPAIAKQNELGPGEESIQEYTFKYGKSIIDGLARFYFRVQTDALSSVSESNESNNYSEGILIGL